MDTKLIEEEAQQANSWMVIAAVQIHPGGDGYLPHGIIAFKRPRNTVRDRYLGEGHEYGTAMWSDQRNHGPGITVVGVAILFTQGHYDITVEDALDDFRKRSTRLERGAPA